MLARGREDAAFAAFARARELGREAGEPQAALPAFSAEAFAFAEVGDRVRATAAVDELLADALSQQRFELWLYPAVFALDELGRLDDLRGVLPAEGASVVRWVDAGRLHAEGDLAGAADVLREIGSATDEARTRIRLAEQLAAAGHRADADAELARATAFYRSVGATFYLRRAERVLAASA